MSECTRIEMTFISWFVITTVIFPSLCEAAGKDSVLARIAWDDLDDGKSLRLTITPLSGERYWSAHSSEGDNRTTVDHGEVFPDEEGVNFNLTSIHRAGRHEDHVRLHVKRDDVFDKNFPVIVDGQTRNDLMKRNLAYYTTPDQSSISVETENGANKRRVRRYAEGEFYHRGQRYHVSHSAESSRGNRLHMITRKPAVSDPLSGPPIRETETRRPREKKKAGPYYIELAVITDVSIFLHMSRRAKSANKEQVIKNIHHRVGHIIHGVDLAYRRMKLVDLTVWLRALYVSTEFATSLPITINALDNASAPRWDDVNPRKNCKADANKIRVNVNNWLSRQTLQADHAMAFTMYDLWDMKDNIDVVGQADYANMCGPEKWRSSCVEWGSFHMWATAAHELAHNLNVAHDGQDTSEMCDPMNYYLMTTDSVYHDRATIDNGFRFSECSELTILKTIEQNESPLSLSMKRKRLDLHVRSIVAMGPLQPQGSSIRDDRNCLFNKVTSHTAGIGAHLNTSLPGEEYDLRQQCQIVYGDTSLPCVRMTDFSKICVILYCTNPASTTTRCQNPGDFRAAMGTSCGNMKWCYEGKCVNNSRAKPYNPFTASKNWVRL